MSQPPGSFRPTELDGADPAPGDAELAGAYAMAREIESALPRDTVTPSAGFADRVMAAVSREPAPRPTGFLVAVREHPGLAGLVVSVREAWAVAAHGSGRPARARGLALGYLVAVLVVATSLTGVAAYGAAGGLGLRDGNASPSPSVVAPSPRPSASSGPTSPAPDASTSPQPGESTEPDGSGAPEASAEPDESAEPAETAEPSGSHEPEPSDDSGLAPNSAAPGSSPTSSPRPSDDGGASPLPSDGDSSPEPNGSPRASDSPRPSETPH